MGSLLNAQRVEELLEKWRTNIPSSLDQLPVILKCHPAIAVFLFIFTMMASMPFLLFMCFALGSFSVTFISFVLVEGTLLALGTCVLAPILFFIAVTAITISLSFGTLWFILTSCRPLVGKWQQFLDNQIK